MAMLSAHVMDKADSRRQSGQRAAAHPDAAGQAARLPRQHPGRDRRHGGARRQRLHRGVGQRPARARRPYRRAVGGHEQHQRARRGAARRRQGGCATRRWRPSCAGGSPKAARCRVPSSARLDGAVRSRDRLRAEPPRASRLASAHARAGGARALQCGERRHAGLGGDAARLRCAPRHRSAASSSSTAWRRPIRSRPVTTPGSARPSTCCSSQAGCLGSRRRDFWWHDRAGLGQERSDAGAND